MSMVATTVSSQILKTMAKAEGFKYDVCGKFSGLIEIILLKKYSSVLSALV